MANLGWEDTAWKTQMVISLISCESQEGSEWDAATANAADRHGELKGHRPAGWHWSGREGPTRRTLRECREMVVVRRLAKGTQGRVQKFCLPVEVGR